MRNESWIEAFAHELEAAGVPTAERAEILVETDGFLAEAGVIAIEHFGAPQNYAQAVLSALGGPEGEQPDAGERPTVLAVTSLSKSYRHRRILSDVTFTLGKGGMVALTGPNGSGKSTLLRIIAGLEARDGGTIESVGAIGYVPQSGGLDDHLTPAEHFALFGCAAGLSASDAVAEGARLSRELGWDALSAPVAGGLSGGTQQKLSVVVALLGSPAILLLDEPYQGMDAESTRRFWELLWSWQADGGSAVVASHAPDVLRTASEVVELAPVSSR